MYSIWVMIDEPLISYTPFKHHFFFFPFFDHITSYVKFFTAYLSFIHFSPL